MEPVQILLVDDEPDLRRSLHDFLKHEAFQITCADSAERALDLLTQERPDLILLDLNLPQMSGFEMCRRLKASQELANVPVLILSSRTSEPDKVMGLELGADDYLVKPFGLRELLARVRALLRRAQGAFESPSQALQAGALRMDPQSHTAQLSEKALQLTPKEFDLLALLVHHKNQLLRRERLLQALWPEAPSSTNTLDVHINRLRDKLGHGGVCIETYKGLGYKLTGV